MGGEISLQSAEGQGSVFWFTLRFEKPDQQDLFHKHPEKLRAEGEITQVLVVDDNASSLALTAELLSNNGYDSKQAGDGETALQLLRVAAMEGKPFHIAVLDEQMPGMDGLELGRRIKADPLIRSTRLIVMTPVGQRVDTAALEALDGAVHLAKPIRQTPLLNSVATAMKTGTSTRPDETTNAIAKPALINKTKFRFPDPDRFLAT